MLGLEMRPMPVGVEFMKGDIVFKLLWGKCKVFALIHEPADCIDRGCCSKGWREYSSKQVGSVWGDELTNFR